MDKWKQEYGEPARLWHLELITLIEQYGGDRKEMLRRAADMVYFKSYLSGLEMGKMEAEWLIQRAKENA